MTFVSGHAEFVCKLRFGVKIIVGKTIKFALKWSPKIDCTVFSLDRHKNDLNDRRFKWKMACGRRWVWAHFYFNEISRDSLPSNYCLVYIAWTSSFGSISGLFGLNKMTSSGKFNYHTMSQSLLHNTLRLSDILRRTTQKNTRPLRATIKFWPQPHTRSP